VKLPFKRRGVTAAPPSAAGATVRRLEPRHAEDAAALCASALARHSQLDSGFPTIPAASDVEPALLLSWRARLADPATAACGRFEDGRLTATLAASYRRTAPDSPERIFAPLLGAWLPQTLCAVATGRAPSEVLPSLYAAVATWLAQQHVALHFATAATADTPLLAAWRALGFRPQGVFALLTDESRERLLARPLSRGITLRTATPDDRGAIVALLAESHRYHAALPGSFFDPADGDRHYPALVRGELAGVPPWGLGSPTGGMDPSGEPRYVLALDGDRVVGLASGYVERPIVPDLAAYTRSHPLGYIAEVAVTAAYRGQGIAAMLVAALLSWFDAHGAAHIGLHYIANNPSASRAWPALGFRALEVRLQGGPDPSKRFLPEELPA
jgi:ribosomal protein S18 acetylase RimI-like enzyme